MNNEIWRDVVADLASIVRVQNGNLHADINELLDRAKAVLATQPPQDERGRGLLNQILQISDLYRNSDMTEGNFTCRVIDAIQAAPLQPAQPVALSTLTNSEIVKQVKNSFDSYDHAEINRRELVQSIRAALSGTGSDESKKGEA